jgi:thiamine-phosphate pyrophosphorylase
MTDERMGEDLWDALARLPRGSGVIFRHYATRDRRALFDRVRSVARKRRLVLILAGTPGEAVACGGWGGRGAPGAPTADRHTDALRARCSVLPLRMMQASW